MQPVCLVKPQYSRLECYYRQVLITIQASPSLHQLLPMSFISVKSFTCCLFFLSAENVKLQKYQKAASKRANNRDVTHLPMSEQISESAATAPCKKPPRSQPSFSHLIPSAKAIMIPTSMNSKRIMKESQPRDTVILPNFRVLVSEILLNALILGPLLILLDLNFYLIFFLFFFLFACILMPLLVIWVYLPFNASLNCSL